MCKIMMRTHLFLIAALFFGGGVIGQEIRDATQDLPSPVDSLPKGQQDKIDNSESRRLANRAALLKELDNLIPGEFAEGSARETGLGEVVDLYLAGKPDDGFARLKQLAEEDPGLPPVDLLLAGILFAANNPDSGRATLERAALAAPDYPGVFAAFARVAINEGRLTDAQALLEKTERLIGAGDLDAEEKEFFRINWLGSTIDVAMRRDQFEVARQALNELQQLQPESTKVLLTSAELDFEAGEIDSCLEWLRKLKAKANSTPEAELVVARWLLRKNKSDEAGVYLQAAADKFPGDGDVQLEFAKYSLINGDFQLAREAVEKIEARRGESPATLSLKARIAFATEEYGLAEAHYDRLLRLVPSDFDTANLYALSLIESDDAAKRERARQMATRTFQQSPDNQIATAALGWILLKSDRLEEAAGLLGRAAQMPRIPPELSFYLANLLQEQGQSERARMVLQPALDSEDFFLYRSRAEALMAEITKSLSDGNRP